MDNTYTLYIAAIACAIILMAARPISKWLSIKLHINLTEKDKKTIDRIIERGIDYVLDMPNQTTKEAKIEAALQYIVDSAKYAGVDKKFFPYIKALGRDALRKKLK